MKKSAWFILLLILTPLAFAQISPYQQDSLYLQLDVKGGFELIPEANGARVKDVSVELFLFPNQTFRQEVLEIDTIGERKKDRISYKWNDKKLGVKEFRYSALIKTKNQRNKVKKRIPYPIQNLEGFEAYTLPSAKIDSDNPNIVKKARELADGEDDLFKVSFKLANWVAENVDYELNELTTEIAQPASWVLENRQGVCDEMTALYVAMMRSLGVPARFVSGISYTENADVLATIGKNWANHGWAEVYFPSVGWVSFDITFDEYGYVDVTHIKLREGLDPDDPATRYEWSSREVKLEPLSLDQNVILKKEGNFVPEEVLLEQEILAKEVGFDSYNLIKGILKNTADYYVATTLSASTPNEVEVVGENKRTILLEPKEIRETFWILKISDTLNSQYIYELPVLIYTEKNVTVQDSFISQKGKLKYSKQEIEKLTVKDEEKSYSRKVNFDCDYPANVKLNENIKISCTIKNRGITDLYNVLFCIEKECEVIDLLINQEKSKELQLPTDTKGWHKISMSVENNVIEKRSSVSYAVLDEPKINVNPIYPKSVSFDEKLKISIHLEKESFATPENLVIILKGDGFQNRWEINNLQQEETLQFDVKDLQLSRKNKFTITAKWNDNQEKEYSDKQNITVLGESNTFKESVKMFFNGIINSFL